MVLVKSVQIDIGVKGDAESKVKLDDITKRAEALKKAFPEYKLKIDSAAAAERLKVFRAQLAEATRPRTAEVKVKVDDSALAKFAAKMKAGGGPAWLGPALMLAPAAASLGGVAAGAGIGLAGAAAAGAAALAAFGAVAKPVLADALKAQTAVNTAQNNYTVAITHGVAPAKAYAAEQKAIAKAYADMSPQQIALSKQLGTMAGAWQNLKAAQTPVVAGALQPWLRSVTDLTKNLAPIIAKVSPVIHDLGTQFAALVSSAAFRGFRDFVANTGSKVVGAGGGTLIDFVKSFMILLPKFNPLILKMTGGIAGLGPAVLKWASSKKASDDITRFMDWFNRNGPVVGGLLKNIGGALKAMAPGLTTGGMLELQVMSQFFGLIAKLPPGVAKPLFEVAGALLLLNKVGVVTAGVKLVGLGAAASGLSAGAFGGLAAGGAAIAGGLILKIREDLKSGWRGIVHDLPGWLGGVGGILNLSATGWSSTILDKFSRPVRRMWSDLGHYLAASFDQTRHAVAHVADSLGHYLTSSFDQTRHSISRIWDLARHDASAAWDAIWNNTVGRTRRGISDVMGWVGSLPGRITGVFRGAGGWLVGQGQGIINGLWSGIKGVWSAVSSWFTGLPKRILSALGIHSPPDWAISAGKSIMQGLHIGLGHGLGQLTAFTGSIGSQVANAALGALSGGSPVPSVGSGIARWAPLVKQALAMEHLNPGYILDVLYQMQTESGGNPNAINLTDINAQHGDPSKGLMQVIGGTFARWHWPGTSGNIYDPLANIAAALNYAAHGRGFGGGPGQIGSGHGYASGTSSAAPGWAWVGERGPELMRFRGGEQVAPVHSRGGGRGGDIYITVNAPVGSSPREIGRQVAEVLGAHIKGGGRIYPAGVTPR